MTKNKQVVKHIVSIFLIVLGAFVMGSAYNMFYKPNNIIMGGFSGLANLICYFFSSVGFEVPMAVVYLILNAVIFIFAVKILGKKFGCYALIGILSYSLFLEVCKFNPISNDLLLCSIYGGVITGLGTGVVVRFGGSTGGSEMLGCIVNHKKPTISIGLVTISMNTLVIGISLLVFGLNLSLYALIAIFISGKTADTIIEGPKSVKAYFIISKNSDELATKFINDLHRGVTCVEVYGKYSGDKLEMIMCLVSSHQVNQLKEAIYDIDKDAFLFAVPVKEAMGRGFSKLEKQKKLVFSKEKFKLSKKQKKSQNFTQIPTNENWEE